jgi:transmembrane sensor
MNLQMQIDKKANQWLIKEKEGLSFQEQKELKLWLENINHKKAYDENKKLINECLHLDEDFIKELENEVLNNKEEEQNIFYKSRYLAASIIIACIVVFSLFEVKNYYFKPTFLTNYITSNKKSLNIKLPDNSIVDLDLKSQIEVVYYNNKRTVQLNRGTAMFSIAKNKEKPFFIKSGKTLIEVVGTKFEVINQNNITTINVLEGVVKVSHIYNNQGDIQTLIRLKKAQSFSLNNKGEVLNYNTINTKIIASWKEDMVNFDKTTLKEASSLFEKYSNRKMKFANYELSQLKISGKFSTLHYDSFLEAIELIYPVKIEKDGIIVKVLNK